MSGLLRLTRSVTRKSGSLRFLPSTRLRATPPTFLAGLQADPVQITSRLPQPSHGIRSLSSQVDNANHEEPATDETPEEGTTENGGTMNRKKIRGMKYLIVQHCRKRDYTSADAAENLLTQLADEAILQGRPLVNIALHNNCLDAWAKSGIKSAYLKASGLLDRIWERHQRHPEICPAPNTISYHSVLDACANSSAHFSLPKAAAKAEEVIKEMEHHALENPDGDIQPFNWTYNLVIKTYANQAHDTYGAANSAEDWLRYLSKSSTEGGPGPDTHSFNTVLKAWKQCPENRGADRALELLHLMIKLFHEGHHEQVTPDQFSFGSVIQAFGDRGRPEEAEDVLKLALGFYLDDESVALKLALPDGSIDLRACFNIAIAGWARSGREEATEKADALLFDMRALSQETSLVNTQPDVYTYTSCMDAMAHCGREDAPELVESRLYSLVELHEQYRQGSRNNFYPSPNAACFDCAMRAWYQSQKPNREEHMEALLNKSMQLGQRWRDDNLLPEPRTVNMCLKALCLAGKGRERAIPLLNRMEMVRCVDSSSYIPMVIVLLDQAKENNYDFETVFAASTVLEKYQIQVNHLGVLKWHESSRHHYMQVIQALRRVGHPAAADRAYRIVEAMETNNKTRAKPTISMYTSVLLAMARCPSEEFTHRALAMFDHMRKLHYDEKLSQQLDTSAFVAMLTYLAATKQEWAADRAESLLNALMQMHMESRNDDKKLRPDFRCYDKCLSARARCGDVSGAVKKLKLFVEDYREGRAMDVPSELGIDVVYRCCLRVGTEEGAKLAEEALAIKEMLRNEGNLREHEIVKYEY